ncbi:MAG: putative metal-dependent phosphoesterase TrpH [Oleiphilaceae bacterium]|jgi:predicted metal-dependent phosphoesterase TrpH
MQRSNIDLHCHSLASDGALSPADVVVRAVENGVTLLALTDHDTIEGQVEAMKQAKALNIEMVSGIELSCVWGSSLVHILGLNFSLSDGIMQEVQEKQSQARLLRAELIAEKLIKKGLPDLLESAKSLAQSGVPGRPHFSEAMISQGLVSGHKEAFKKYLGAGKVGDVKSTWPDLSEVLSWIHTAKGDAVIAHPRKYKMSQTKLRELIGDFKDEGGIGIEVVVSGQKQGEIGLMSDLCNRFELKGSVGSDFHTPEFPWANLGRIPSLPDSVEPIWRAWELGV